MVSALGRRFDQLDNISKKEMVAIRAIEMQKLLLPPPTSAATPRAATSHVTSCLRAEVSIESVQVVLNKVLASESFAKSPKHRYFLEFIVGEVIAGRDSHLKEYTVGVEVFGRPESFDSRDDPIVRVTASRVRAKLKAYFENEGKDAPVVIELPRGSYVPVFQPRLNAVEVSAEAPPSVPLTTKTWRPVSWTSGTVLSLIAIAVWLLTLGWSPLVAIASAVTRGNSGRVAESPSIAILPFVNVGPDPGADYEARWLTAAVADVLPDVNSGQGTAPLALIGPVGRPSSDERGALHPDKVLQGWVWQSNGRVRVTAQLIDLKSGFHIWSDVYECEPKELFELQHAIASGMARALRPHPAVGSRGRLPVDRAPNLEALNFYLDGMYQMEHRTGPAIRRAIDYFQQSISTSSSHFSLAYSRLAEAYLASMRYSLTPARDVLPEAELAAQTALESDGNSADAHASLALVKSLNWQWDTAAKEFAQAIKLEPDNAAVREQYALNYLVPMGRFDDALKELHVAQTLNPSSPTIEVSLGSTYYYKGNNDQAIDHCRKGLNLGPDSREALFCLGSAFEEKAMFREATGILNNMGNSARDTAVMSFAGHIVGVEGKTVDAKALLSQLDQLSREQNVPSYDKSLIHLGLGNADDAFKCATRAYEEHDPRLMYLAVSPRWKHIRAEPRFAAMLSKIGLPAL